MNSAPITIHVGLMKTATTTLQLRVFPQHEELCYLGGPDFQHDAIRLAIASISKQDRLMYDQDYHKVQIESVLAEVKNQGKPVLLSAESLTTPTVDRLTKAERLVGLFGEIRIVLCLRRPVDLMTSLYSESIKQLDPRSHRLPSLNSWLDSEWSDQRATRHTRILDFSRRIRSYHQLVGEENVCVLLFEDLCYEPKEYARQLSEFVGINAERTLELLQAPKENKSVSQLDYKLFKLTNLLGFHVGDKRLTQFIPRPVKEVLKRSMSGSQRFEMSEEWRDRIKDFIREENKDLCNLIGSGPERYDYF